MLFRSDYVEIMLANGVQNIGQNFDAATCLLLIFILCDVYLVLDSIFNSIVKGSKGIEELGFPILDCRLC